MPRILLVDDDIAEISAVKRVLTRAGHQPVLATNAADAMAALGQQRPELVVFSATCDNGLAIGLARRLPQDPDMAGIPLLVLGDAEDLPEGARKLARPVDPEALTSEVKAALGQAGAVTVEDSPPVKAAAAPPRPAGKPAARAAGKPTPSRPAAGKGAPAREKSVPVARVQPSRAAAPVPGTRLADAAASRRAAAEALRARAEELRRTSQRVGTGQEAAPAADGAAERPPSEEPSDAPGLDPAPAAAPASAVITPPPPSAPAPKPTRSFLAGSLDLDDDSSFEAALQRAGVAPEGGWPASEASESDAERALAALEQETGASRSSASRPRRAAPPPEEAPPPPTAPAQERDRDHAAEEHALQEAIATARREAFEAAKRELQERARQEAAEAARLVQAEARGRREEVAEVQRKAKELARREAEAAERARTAEEEVEALRAQLLEERRKADERVATVMQRAAEEEEAALQRMEAPPPRRPAGAAFTPPPFFAPFDGAEGSEPAPDPTEGEARRRVAALRSGQAAPGHAPTPAPAPTPEPEAAWPEPPPAEQPEPEPEARTIPQPIPQLRSGDLAELPAPRLLALAFRNGLGGRLDFRGEGARSLWFEDGRVVGASSSDPSERVEEVALRLGLVTRDQHRQIAQAASSLSTRRAAVLLLERGFLKDTELTALVRRRTEEVVFGVFADAGARFRWAATEVPPEERIALDRGTLALAVEGVRRRWLAPRIDQLLGGPATLLAPAQGAPPVSELGLSADERRVVTLADGLRALEEIVHASPLDALSARQVLAALVLVGALAVRSLQASRPTAHASAAIDLARVREKLDQVRRADYFTVLGVGRLCTPHEVREAAERLQAEYDPQRFAGRGDEGLPARLAEILQVIRDAREVLADDRLREEYLRGLGDVG